MSDELQTILLVVVPAVTYLVIFGLGAAKKLVIYYDSLDLAVCTLPWIFLLIGYMYFDRIGGPAYAASSDSLHLFFQHNRAILTDQQILVSKVSVISAACVAMWSIVGSIQHNGSIIVGLVVGTFRLATSLISIGIFTGQFGKILDNKGGSSALGPAAILLLLFVLVALVLVNGKDVEFERRIKANLAAES